jgi:hypothetical protein
MTDTRNPREAVTLFADFAFAWSITGITVIRARSQAQAQAKFDAMSRAAMLNRSDPAFHRAPIELHPEAGASLFARAKS